jgi:guanosine-3',5'-bis(diphosphate) 3'-pyrophosphohydrolase
VREAYKFADAAHLGQFRASGQPYITHPIAVAGLCADWRLDAQAIMAALMHDTIEDQGIKKSELIEKFGAPTADLVDGLTKLDKLHFSTREESQAESFRKMLLAMARDVRVILIKLADRLHNMRTMQAMAPDKRHRIARETLDIYAPIAHRLGLNQMYRELQELCFELLYPWRHAALAKAVKRARGHRRDIVERVQAEVEKAFAAAEDQGSGQRAREDHLQHLPQDARKHAGFAQVSDIFGFRIVVPTLTDCYVALGVLHQLYKPVPGRFKDYIAIPKANGYQSLHTTLVSPLGTAVEFQMRTETMHAVAEAGIAAHWLYKSGERPDQGRPTVSTPNVCPRCGCKACWRSRTKHATRPSSWNTSRSTSTPTRSTSSRHAARSWRCHAVPRRWTLPTPSTPTWASTRWRPRSTASRPRCAPNSRAATWWRSSPPGARAQPGLAEHGAHGARAQQDPPVPEEHGSRRIARAGREDAGPGTAGEGLQLPSSDPGDTQAAALWQQLTRWSGNRHRGDLMVDIGTGAQDRHHRGQAAGADDAGARHQARRGDPDAGPLRAGRRRCPRKAWSSWMAARGNSIQLATCCRPIPGDAIVGYLGRGEGLLVHTATAPPASDCSNVTANAGCRWNGPKN